jgi:taurine dioxygenase
VPVVTANAMHSDRVAGLTEAQSEAMLAELFAHLYAPANTYALDWEVGDLAVWDNLALQHHRPDFPATEPRTMQRVCINEKSAHDLVPNMAELVAAGKGGTPE